MTPNAKQLAWISSFSAQSIREAEVRVCNALEWNLLLNTAAVSPACDVPSL